MKSYGEALDSSVSERVEMVKKPLEGLQNVKYDFVKHVAIFFDVYGV